MNIYIEHEKEFYDFSALEITEPDKFFRTARTIDNTPFSDCQNLITDKRNFEIGARVYFEGPGWTEVVRGGCDFCVLHKKSCVMFDCGSGYYKKLEVSESPEQQAYNRINRKGSTIQTMKKVVVTGAQGMKYDAGKIRPSLIPVECLEEIAKVLTYGAEKYAPDNWKQISPERYHDALWRHYIAWQKGEKADCESGLSHAAHFAVNAIFLLWFEIQKDEEVTK